MRCLMENETPRKKQFKEALNNISIMLDKSLVRVEDIKYLLDAGFKLSMEFDRVYDSRAKWRARAETAEAKLKSL